MPTLVETSRRLVLRFDEGQFAFSRYNHAATNEQLYGLAHYINALQEDDVEQVVQVRVLQLLQPES